MKNLTQRRKSAESAKEFKMNKTKKHLTVMAMIAIITLSLTALSMTGCEPEVVTEYVNVEVPVEREILRGYVTEAVTNKQIPIYQSVGVSDDDAVVKTNNTITSYSSMTVSNKQDARGRISKILIVNGDKVNYTKSTGVIEIGTDCTASWNDIIIEVIVPAFAE